MAFPNLNAQQELNNRKLLEEITLKKQLLQKGVSPVGNAIPIIPSTTPNIMPQFIPNNQTTNDIQLNTPARVAWNQANSQSLGFFVPQDSVFGNNILPVLPRLDTPAQK